MPHDDATVRSAAQGDRSPDLAAPHIEQWTVNEAVTAARQRQITALRDVVTNADDEDAAEVRVMGFCDDAEHREFMRQAPEFERQLVRSGVHLVKLWFSVTRAEQRRRFSERERHPLKQWKLSPVDLASLGKWDDYTEAKETMFMRTDTLEAPWTIVKSDCKKRARLNALRYVLHSVPYDGKDHEALGQLDPLIVGRADVLDAQAESDPD